MYTPEERDALRRELLAAARADPRITGGAITGSASVGKEDRWSDIDLAFGVRESSEVGATLADFSELMYSNHHALHHVDVRRDAWIYRVFLLRNGLQVDLAFAPTAEFGPRAPTFQLVFGTAIDKTQSIAGSAEETIALAWLFALHARSSIARGKFWQAEYMISAMRDQVLAAACIRHGLPASEGRGIDSLPEGVTMPFRGTLARALDAQELLRAFRATMGGLIREIRDHDAGLERLEQTLLDLT